MLPSSNDARLQPASQAHLEQVLWLIDRRRRGDCLNVHEYATLHEVRAALTGRRGDYNHHPRSVVLCHLGPNEFATNCGNTDHEAPALQLRARKERTDVQCGQTLDSPAT